MTSVLLFCVVAGILVVVLLPAEALGARSGRIRSLTEMQSWFVHGALFAMLGGAVGLRLAAPRPSRLTMIWALSAGLLIVAFATASEFAQFAVSGRTASVGDWTADLIGTIVGLAVAATIGPPILDWLTSTNGD